MSRRDRELHAEDSGNLERAVPPVDSDQDSPGADREHENARRTRPPPERLHRTAERVRQDEVLEAHTGPEVERAGAQAADRPGGDLDHPGSSIAHPQLGVNRSFRKLERPSGGLRREPDRSQVGARKP